MVMLFWVLCGLVVYVYFGYPLALRVLQRLGPGQPRLDTEFEPGVTLVISAYNEEASIGEKLANSLEIDYPSEKLQILVVSDASSDRTDDIVLGFPHERVGLLRMPNRGGKTVGLNRAVREAKGEIVVFSDANALYYPDALRALVRTFGDPRVGAAVGESTYVNLNAEAERSEGLYWRYEVAIKKLESDLGSVVGGDGAIYAIRKGLYHDMKPDALSDFVNPLQIVEQGYRVVYVPAARSYEDAGGDFHKEFRRKIRIVNRAWRATWNMPQMLNPARFGLFAFQMWSHKVLRWLVPVFLVLLFAVSSSLRAAGSVYAAAFWLQIAFYALALAGWFLRNATRMPKLLSVPFFFCLVNLASARGIWDALRGKTYTTWATARSVDQT